MAEKIKIEKIIKKKLLDIIVMLVVTNVATGWPNERNVLDDGRSNVASNVAFLWPPL